MARRAIVLAAALAAVSCNDADPELASSTFVITGASVHDGQGSQARRMNVYVEGERIKSVSEAPPPAGVEVVDGFALTLAPGFIDTHSHGDRDLSAHRDALAAVSQGITTIVVGQDGSSPMPLSDFLDGLEAEPAAVNVASYAGHGTIRRQILGDDFRRVANDEEIERMRRLLAREMEAGALGLSTGLEYDPGIYSNSEELLALAREAGSWGGRYASHLRSEDRGFWEAVNEIIDVGRRAVVPVHISHVKLAMTSNWGNVSTLIARLEDARGSGVDISADIYPYTYWQSTMTVMFPKRDFQDRNAAEFAVTELSTPEGLRIARYAPRPEYEGKTLAEIAELRRSDPAKALMDLIREAETLKAAGETGVESVIATSMDERDIEQLMSWRHTNIATDGAFDGAHPRGYGTYPRVLGRYVRERDVLTLPDAVRKMTWLAAEHMGITNRGRIQPGFRADLVLFDAAKVVDNATPEEPHALSTGIVKVWVNGVAVFDNGAATGAYPGRVLRRP